MPDNIINAPGHSDTADFTPGPVPVPTHPDEAARALGFPDAAAWVRGGGDARQFIEAVRGEGTVPVPAPVPTPAPTLPPPTVHAVAIQAHGFSVPLPGWTGEVFVNVSYIHGFSGNDSGHFTDPYGPIDWALTRQSVRNLLSNPPGWYIPRDATLMLNTGVWEAGIGYDGRSATYKRRVRENLRGLHTVVREVQAELGQAHRVTGWGQTPDMVPDYDLYVAQCYLQFTSDPTNLVRAACEIAIECDDLDERTAKPVYGCVEAQAGMTSEQFRAQCEGVLAAGARVLVWAETEGKPERLAEVARLVHAAPQSTS